jgi:hypothetical protein
VTAGVLRPGWPLVVLLALYPLWWVLGLGVLVFPILALPMLVILVRYRFAGRPVALPPGFGWWLIFLAAVLVSTAALGSTPPGTVPGDGPSRALAVGFRLVEYLSLTVLLVYAGNLSAAELPQARLVRLLAWLFGVTVLGGLLGLVAGRFGFASPAELLLPSWLRTNGFVQSLVHPSAAQVQHVLGSASARPAAPWGYTNTWGNNFCLLVVWFVVACWALPAQPAQPAQRRLRVFGVLGLAVAFVPMVLSLNRGLWVGLLVMVGYAGIRYLRPSRALAGAAIGAAGLALALAVTPLGGVVADRLAHGKSNSVRLYLTERAVTDLAGSPVIGYGSTRDTLGGRSSVAIGESTNCARCGNFTIGGNGQLWQLLFAHGLAGTAGYLAFFGTALWRFRHDRSPVGLAGQAALVGTFSAMLWYNALVTPLAFTMLGFAHHPEIAESRVGSARVLGQIACWQAAAGYRGPAVRTAGQALRRNWREPRGLIALAAATGAVRIEWVLDTLHRHGHGI